MENWKRELYLHAAWAVIGAAISYWCGGDIGDMIIVAAVVVACRYINYN